MIEGFGNLYSAARATFVCRFGCKFITAVFCSKDYQLCECDCHKLWHELNDLSDPPHFPCPIAAIETGGKFYCTRERGHAGPCAAVPTKG